MAEHDWKQLLDDPEVVEVVRRVYNGPGRRYYSSSRQALALDDLESWLWDRAVDLAERYSAPPAASADPADRFRRFLYVSLKRAITEGWHYNGFAGKPESSRRAINDHSISLDLELEGGHRHIEEAASLAGNRRINPNDPLAVMLHLERLQRLLGRAERQAATGPYLTQSSPYCSENLCLQPASTKGLCKKHYQRESRAWGGTCSVQDCTGGVIAKGLCSTHYGAQLRARPDRPSCSADGCTNSAKARGLCDKHYRHSRAANAEAWAAERAAKPASCTTPGCNRPPHAKGLCDTHYAALKRARHKERATYQ